MLFKIISTTDGKHEGEQVEFNKHLNVGEVLVYKDVDYTIDAIEWNFPLVKIVCSNYVAVLQVIKQ
jgi:hypothetical protein